MTPEWAKVVTMISLGVGSLIIGLIPAAFAQHNLRRNPLLLTFLLCFGAGILMATSLVHMLPEVSEDLGHGYAEIVFCLGFLFVYLADEVLHYCCGEAIQHSHGLTNEENPLLPQHSSGSSYGTSTSRSKATDGLETSCEEHQHMHDIEDERINERLCHTNHQQPCTQTMAGLIGMLTALTVHALIEGLAIGIQDTTAKVMILFAAVASHKFVVGFCLGIELSVNAPRFLYHFICIFVFAFGSSLGIALGMGLVDLNTFGSSKTLPILQGIAAGTLLYVVVCEVLPREKARWHKNRVNNAVGLAQLVAFSFGFAVMTILNIYVKDE